jgi:hypothetical protein
MPTRCTFPGLSEVEPGVKLKPGVKMIVEHVPESG